MSGSSPCKLTTMSGSCMASRSTASARRSVPEGWSARVMTTSAPKPRATSAIRSLSVATSTRAAPLSSARWCTCWIIGCPSKSASGLPGKRVEPSRAGMMTVNSTGLMGTFQDSHQQRIQGVARRRIGLGAHRQHPTAIGNGAGDLHGILGSHKDRQIVVERQLLGAKAVVIGKGVLDGLEAQAAHLVEEALRIADA